MRWSPRSSFDSSTAHTFDDNKESRDSGLLLPLGNTFSQEMCKITLSHHTALCRQLIDHAVHIKADFEPIVCLQKTLLEVMNTAENSMAMIAMALQPSLAEAIDSLLSEISPDAVSTTSLQHTKTGNICNILELLATIAQWAVSFVGIGDGHHALHVSVQCVSAENCQQLSFVVLIDMYFRMRLLK